MSLLKQIIITLLPLAIGASSDELDQFLHLPRTVKPIRYNLTIQPHSDTSYSGSVIIDIKVLRITKNITFHSKDLTLKSFQLLDASGEDVEILYPVLDTENDLCVLFLRSHLIKYERYKLIIEGFVGTLNHVKSGFFLAKYIDRNGEDRNLSLTHFEPCGARTAFPCFDEPGLRAKFIVNIIRSANFNSASNEKLEKSTYLGNGLVQDTFRETVEMPTYLVAFVISEFVYTKEVDRVRVLARPDAIADGSADYILYESVRLLRAMEDYTGLKYSLSKMDLLAVPSSYFVDGAMENWGLVIYSEDNLLYRKLTSTTEDLQRCATFSAHELSHQWFGNLVTPKTWNYIWLSEGFAAYFQYYITDVVEPTWRLKEQFVVEQLQKALTGDIAPMAQPLNYIFPDPAEFPSAWMYYYKASSIIRMTEHFLTPPVFREGLRIYLERKKFSTSHPIDVYKALQTAVSNANAHHLLGDSTVPKILSTWDTNVGYPLITATRNYATGTITLTQETYTTDNSTDDNIWFVPITYVIHGNKKTNFAQTTTDVWLTQRTVTLRDFDTSSWVLLNNQHAGYYRVNYDITNWYRVITFLQTYAFRSIHVLNRAQLINDVFQLVEDGKLNAKIALDLSEYIRQETDFIALKPFLQRIDSFDFMVAVTNEYELFQAYVRKILSFALEHIGLEERLRDTHIRKLTRVIVLRRMCLYGDERCQQYGLQKLKQWERTGTLRIPFEVEQHLLCGAMQIANRREWEFLLHQYYTTDEKSRKLHYIAALSCTRNKALLNNFLDTIYNFNNPMSPPDRVKALVNIVDSNFYGRKLVLEYITTKTIAKNSSFEEAVTQDRITQIIRSEYSNKLDILQDSDNSKYLPANFFTRESLEPHENNYIDQISQWLLNRFN